MSAVMTSAPPFSSPPPPPLALPSAAPPPAPCPPGSAELGLDVAALYNGQELNMTAVLVVFESFPLDERRHFLSLLGLDNSTEILHFLARAQDAPVGPDRPQLTDFYSYRVHKLLLMYLPPVFIAVGIVGNLLSFAVLSRPAMRRVSAYLYLAVLSLADTLVLLVGLLRLWVAEITGYDPQDGSEFTCKVISVLGSAVSDYAVWLLITVTAERFIAVCHPLRASTLCGRSRAIAVIISLLVILLLVNLHFFWTTQLLYNTSGARSLTEGARGAAGTPGGGRGHCEAAPGYEVLVDRVWPWVDAFIYSLIPFVTILVLNTLIIRKVLQSRRRRAALCPAASATSQASSPSSGDPVLPPPSEQGAKLSMMLLTVSFAFLLTTLPMNAILIVTAFLKAQSSTDSALGARFKLCRTVAELLMYANHSMNFFLYCTTGHKFRLELRAFLACGGRGKGVRSVGNVGPGRAMSHVSHQGVGLVGVPSPSQGIGRNGVVY